MLPNCDLQQLYSYFLWLYFFLYFVYSFSWLIAPVCKVLQGIISPRMLEGQQIQLPLLAKNFLLHYTIFLSVLILRHQPHMFPRLDCNTFLWGTGNVVASLIRKLVSERWAVAWCYIKHQNLHWRVSLFRGPVLKNHVQILACCFLLSVILGNK